MTDEGASEFDNVDAEDGIDPADEVGFGPTHPRGHPISRADADRLASILGVKLSRRFHVEVHFAIAGYLSAALRQAQDGSNRRVGFEVYSAAVRDPLSIGSEPNSDTERAWLSALSDGLRVADELHPIRDDLFGVRRLSRAVDLAGNVADILKPGRGGQINEVRVNFLLSLIEIAERRDARLTLGSKASEAWPSSGLLPFIRNAGIFAKQTGTTLARACEISGEVRAEFINEINGLSDISLSGLRALTSQILKL